MAKKIDWKKTLSKWKFSKYAKTVKNQDDINNISELLNFAGENLYDEIKFFDRNSVFELRSDKINKDRLLIEASKQLNEHARIAKTHLNKRDWITYEMPFVWCTSNKVKYLKFQFTAKNDVFLKMENLRELFLRYHTSKPELGVYCE